MTRARWPTKARPQLYHWDEWKQNSAEPKPVRHTLKVGDLVDVIPPAYWYWGLCEVVELMPDGGYCIGGESIGYGYFTRKQLRKIHPKHYKENE
jgi:hypothetical protein